LILESTHDFLVDLGHTKRAQQIIVGFAAETDNVIDNARAKLTRKNLDLIVANDVSAPNVGFAHETNEVTILSVDGPPERVSLTTKRLVADRILDAIVTQRSR
jgi:phosphopantothenoylcysteine decarboxylase/phosphopantothenate--cysteine ligase